MLSERSHAGLRAGRSCARTPRSTGAAVVVRAAIPAVPAHLAAQLSVIPGRGPGPQLDESLPRTPHAHSNRHYTPSSLSWRPRPVPPLAPPSARLGAALMLRATGRQEGGARLCHQLYEVWEGRLQLYGCRPPPLLHRQDRSCRYRPAYAGLPGQSVHKRCETRSFASFKTTFRFRGLFPWLTEHPHPAGALRSDARRSPLPRNEERGVGGCLSFPPGGMRGTRRGEAVGRVASGHVRNTPRCSVNWQPGRVNRCGGARLLATRGHRGTVYGALTSPVRRPR